MEDDSRPIPLTITIEGKAFKNMEGFYCEIDRVLTKDLNWETGHNMDALNDLLCGGFGVHNYDELVKLVWKDSAESEATLGESMFSDIVELIREHEHIELVLA